MAGSKVTQTPKAFDAVFVMSGLLRFVEGVQTIGAGGGLIPYTHPLKQPAALHCNTLSAQQPTTHNN